MSTVHFIFADFMQAALLHTINNNNFWLSPDRCLFWEQEEALILSDLHFGKTGHFRKSGIAVPQTVFKEDLQRLLNLVQHFKPRQLIVVGDMFHSSANVELEWFLKWRNDIGQVTIHLIKGNHDILKDSWYGKANMIIHSNQYSLGGFCFTHDIEQSDCDITSSYYFTGHIHPGIILNGMGKQSLRFPCFYFTKKYAILPAFSKFTGLALIEPSATTDIYALVDRSLVKI